MSCIYMETSFLPNRMKDWEDSICRCVRATIVSITAPAKQQNKAVHNRLAHSNTTQRNKNRSPQKGTGMAADTKLPVSRDIPQ